ncbi:hypothetical protein BRYFOR_09334 [Marvinbryantia formatexigens DSM 14469]|uniref:Uncharacterized protein n=2 Tax=Marvinbryantia TaxID=248744 RepID=C6LKY7_9FIRM|nr:hypothetical protein BRYFOR_09334 [Marvinbryantia formatexigens DSM 14469]
MRRIARRKKTLVKLSVITLVMGGLFVYSLIKNVEMLKEIMAMAISAFVSTILAIYMTKEDILENDYAEKKDDFGILTFEDGYKDVFTNKDSQMYLKSMDWENFFAQAKAEKKLYFVGISFYSFFDNIEIRNILYKLCIENKYDIYIILANPFDREIARVNQVEEKSEENELQQRILRTYKFFENDLKNDKNKNAKDKLHIWFSVTIPTALIIKSGKYMIVTPYMLENPERTPTLIIEDSKSQSFYEKYDNYLKVIEKHHYTYEQLRKSISTDEFFTQSYTSLSQEFYADIERSKYVAIIGLSQGRMLRTLGSCYRRLLKKGVKIDIILTDPDGESTKMCARRSSSNRNDIEGDIIVHKEAINRLIDMKKDGELSIYVSDFMYPYTMYAFNCKDGVTEETKMYIWQTVLFEASDKRPGFVCEGEEDQERMESYFRQFRELRDNCDLTHEVIKKYDTEKKGDNKKGFMFGKKK